MRHRVLVQFVMDVIVLAYGAACFSVVYILLSLIFHHRFPW